jgi:hypothetical protein
MLRDVLIATAGAVVVAPLVVLGAFTYLMLTGGIWLW